MNNSTASSGSPEYASTAILYYAYVEIALTPIIIISNVVLIVSILYKRELRHEFRYLSIVSIAVADLIIGLFVAPLRADFGFKRDFVHGCAAHLLGSVFESYVHMFVSMWTMVNMNTDYILKMSYIRTPFLTPLRRGVLFGVILALPWLAMLFIVLPVAYAYAGVYMSNKYCVIYQTGSAYILVSSLVYMVPAAIILIQVVVMTVVRLYRRNRATRIPATLITVDIPTPWILVAASVLTVLLIFVEQLIFMLGNMMVLKMPKKALLFLFLTAKGTSDSKSAILPAVWFFYSDIRASFCELFKKLSCRRTVDVFKLDFKVSYKEFSDETHEACEISI